MPRGTGGLTVAVTGAGGFVGGAVCAELEAAGHSVVRLARRPIDGHQAAILWDLRRDYEGASPLPAVDAVVHCAAAIATLDLDGTAREANVGGSLRVAAAWRGVPLVYVSSASVYPPPLRAADARPLREDDATGEGLRDPYSRSKWEAERALVAEAEASGRELTILRASIVYGPGDLMLFPRIHKLRLGGFVLLPGGRHPWSLTPVGLLARAVRAGVERGAAGVRVVNVADAPPERVRDFFLRLLEEDAGRRAARGPVPGAPHSRGRGVRRGAVAGAAPARRAGAQSGRGRVRQRGARPGRRCARAARCPAGRGARLRVA